MYFYERNMVKKHKMPALGIVLKYLLLQLPGQISFLLILLLLRQWIEIPGYLAWGLFGVWVGKDIVMFPFLWRFYDPSRFPDRFRMDGRKGIAVTRLNPEGYVQVHGERWRAGIAAGQPPVDRGEAIRVEAVDGLKLIVSPWSENQSSKLKAEMQGSRVQGKTP